MKSVAVVNGTAVKGSAKLTALPKILLFSALVSTVSCGSCLNVDYLFDVSGVVTDEDGTPLQGAQVVLQTKTTVYDAITPVNESKIVTGKDGRFEFRYLTDQKNVDYLLKVQKEGYIEQSAHGTNPKEHEVVLKKPHQQHLVGSWY